MAARSAATHVANAMKHSSNEQHVASKELKKIRKEVFEKKERVHDATSSSIKAAVEKAVIKSLAPVKPPNDFTEGW